MLRFYVSDHLENWDENVEALTEVYHLNVHHTTGIQPFDFLLSLPTPDCTFYYGHDSPVPTGKGCIAFSDQPQKAIA